MNCLRKYAFHLAALACVGIWGTTFVSTKVLINEGLTPSEIFMIRFLLAYCCIWWVSPRRLWSDSWRDEMRMVLLGLTGGSVYFLTENVAIGLSPASNVSLLVATAPVLTMLLLRATGAVGRLTGSEIWGSVVALAGVALVVFNGRFVLRLHPAGDLLALTASLMWAVYSLLLRGAGARYPVLLYTRKVFGYGLLTILPVFLFRPPHLDGAVLCRPAVWGNLLFLGIVASMLCYWVWNVALERLGTMRTTNYTFFNPVVTLVAAHLVLGERITAVAACGAMLILAGVWWAERGKKGVPAENRRTSRIRIGRIGFPGGTDPVKKH